MAITALKEEVAHRLIEQRKIRNNLSVMTIEGGPRKVLVKKTRKFFRFNDFLRFGNEKRIYKHLLSIKKLFLGIPTCYKCLYGSTIYIEYLNAQPKESFKVKGFTQAYIEFQYLNITEDLWLDLLNQRFRGLDYKIGGVAVFTISRRGIFQLTWKILDLYKDLKNSQRFLDRKYWLHGDMHLNNFLMDSESNLYFIDFENTFYTRRWPLCEILGECIYCMK